MDYRSPLSGCYDDQQSSSKYGSRYDPYQPHASSRSRRGSNQRTSNTDHQRQSPPKDQSTSRYFGRYRSSKYPKELTDLFGALECKLCGVEVPSPIVAKMHYSGKPHERKVKRYLMEWSLKTGLPMPVIAETSTSQSGLLLPEYCEICDVKLISPSDKILHYSGKNHRKNEQNPDNAKKKNKIYDVVDLSHERFGIGSAFSSDDSGKNDIVLVGQQDFVCDLCDVKAVSQDQLQAHLSGKKHKEKMKKKDSSSPKREKPYVCNLCQVALDTKRLFELHCSGKRHAKNLLKLELENDKNSCTICKLDFPSFDQYEIHIQGKKHVKRYHQQCSEATDVSLTCKFCPFVGNTDLHKCDKSLLKIEHDNLETKFICYICHNMVFDSEQDLNDHQSTRRHALCVLNQESGDKIIEKLNHCYCYVCKKQYRNIKDYTDHFFEQKHMTQSNKQLDFESKTDLFQCIVCNILMDQLGKEEHMRDKKHLKQVIKMDTMETLTKLANANIDTNTFHCKLCNVILNSFVKYSEHTMSDEHIEEMISAELRKN